MIAPTPIVQQANVLPDLRDLLNREPALASEGSGTLAALLPNAPNEAAVLDALDVLYVDGELLT
jgi:hypothetical protein